MEYKYFKEAMLAFKKWELEFDKLEIINNILSPTGTNVVEFGDVFTRDYINLLSKFVGDKGEWISWFIYENDWGEKGLEAGYDKKMKPIKTLRQLYNLIKK